MALTTKYDDASWHYEGEFPADLPREAAATHIGMFVAWALLAGLSGEFHNCDFPEDLIKLQKRLVTPGEFLRLACDEKFTDEDLNGVGNEFARAYFAPLELYLRDYEELLGKDIPSLYHVADTWENFDLFKPRIDQRFEEWNRGALPNPK